MDNDNTQGFFNSVKSAFGNQETDEERLARLRQQALDQIKNKNMQEHLQGFFQKKLDNKT